MTHKLIKVSLVEDDRGTREKLLAVLGNAPSLRCLQAYPSGEEALLKIENEVPDVVLMDINLPGHEWHPMCRSLEG
jgi:DNA-binding NarL/FixJ family response regulator